LIDRAVAEVPDQHVARVIPPATGDAPFLVVFSPVAPTPLGPVPFTSVYLDQHSGEVLRVPSTERSFGDLVMTWVVPLHVGNFGGLPVRVAWLVLGLSPPLLFVTGFAMWWTRVVRPRWSASRRPEAAA
jgi:uncharacterized iron-regulated membrane protein